MDAKLVQELELQMRSFFKARDEGKRQKIRNEIFLQLQPYLDRWVKSNLKNREHLDEGERLSTCWDCFEFCLERWSPKNNIPVPNHFYSYTRFFLLSRLTKEKKKNTDALSLLDREEGDSPENLYGILDDLKKFRERLPTDYRPIFDDALMSMAGHTGDRPSYKKKKDYTYYKYLEAKKAFKFIIGFLLSR